MNRKDQRKQRMTAARRAKNEHGSIIACSCARRLTRIRIVLRQIARRQHLNVIQSGVVVSVG